MCIPGLSAPYAAQVKALEVDRYECGMPGGA